MGDCGEHFTTHPTHPHMVAVCTLPVGHDGEHDNLLCKPAPAALADHTETGGDA